MYPICHLAGDKAAAVAVGTENTGADLLETPLIAIRAISCLYKHLNTLSCDVNICRLCVKQFKLSPSQGEPKQTCKPNGRWCPMSSWDRKRPLGNNQENAVGLKSIKDGLQLIIMYQYWFFVTSVHPNMLRC